MPELENLDDVSFSELVKISVSEIPKLCPEWTDHNAHDPGITFLEMLMWLTEMQRYHLSQITESHIESYLRLVGTTARAAEPAVVLASFFSEEAVAVKNETVFHIGDIPYRLSDDTVISPDKPDIVLCENGGVLVKQDLAPFKGGVFPLYFSANDETAANPMRDGFYPRAEIKARLIARNSDIECFVNDSTYGLYQSGFINISLPAELDESTAFLRLELISDNDQALPLTGRFASDIRELVQTDKDGNTLGAEGRLKENVSFSIHLGDREISAAVYKEIANGKNVETPQDAFERFKSERRNPPRAVGKADYARIALEAPGLRAELVNVFSKETGKVSVCVKTAGGSLSENEIKNLRKVLFEAKPIGTEIEILTPIVFSARLVIGARLDGWAGRRKLAEHIKSVFEPLEKSMGALINMTELYKRIGSSPVVSEITSINLRLGKGIELTEKDEMKLPEDGLLSLDEIMIR